MIRLGQSETTNQLAAGKLGQILLSLRFRAKLINRQHHQRGLHAHHRPKTRVDALYLMCDQAIAHIIESCTTICLWYRGSQQPKATHFFEDFDIGLLVSEAVHDPRFKLLSAVAPRTLLHQTLLLR